MYYTERIFNKLSKFYKKWVRKDYLYKRNTICIVRELKATTSGTSSLLDYKILKEKLYYKYVAHTKYW